MNITGTTNTVLVGDDMFLFFLLKLMSRNKLSGN